MRLLNRESRNISGRTNLEQLINHHDNDNNKKKSIVRNLEIINIFIYSHHENHWVAKTSSGLFTTGWQWQQLWALLHQLAQVVVIEIGSIHHVIPLAAGKAIGKGPIIRGFGGLSPRGAATGAHVADEWLYSDYSEIKSRSGWWL